MKTINIFGEYVEGEEIEYPDQPYKNIIIVEDHKGDKHVVHRDTVDENINAQRAVQAYGLTC